MKIDMNNHLSSYEQLHITPTLATDTFQTPVDSSLNRKNYSSFSLEEREQPTFTTNSYQSNTGYGLVNAGKAVSQAAGDSPYPDAPNLGGNNWGADMVNAPTAWQNGHTGQGIIVAVLDTGIDYNHEDLNNNIWINTKEIAGNGIDDDGNGYIDDVRGWNFDSNNNNVLDDEGHGTHVAGTIAAENNNFGVTGIAYNSQIMAVKVLDENGSGSYSSIANGIRYAVDNGANVINLSLGGGSGNNTLQSAIEYASDRGVIVVMAAGNSGGSVPSYPARYAYDYGLAVGAVNQNNQLTGFSNRAGSQEIKYVTAPGEDIYSTLPNNKYASYTGTSMAAPHVAGVVALMLSANPNLTDSQVRDIITSTAENSGEIDQPSNPSPFPFPIDLFPFPLIDIGSQFPTDIGENFPDIGSGFPLPFQVESTDLNNFSFSTSNLEDINYYSDDNKRWFVRYYDSNLNNDIVKEHNFIWQ
jgi:subtilisin family serine protease